MLPIFLIMFSASNALGSNMSIKNRFVSKPRNERLIERYVEIMGRITALIIGIFAVEMIMQGLKAWLAG